MKILNKYIIKTIFFSILMVVAMWIIIFSLFDFLADSKNIGVSDYSFIDGLYVILLNAPFLVYKHLIAIMLIGTILALGGLASTSQLIIARSSGMSILKITQTVVMFIMFLFFMIALFGELVAPTLADYAQSYKVNKMGLAKVKESSQGFWLKSDNLIINVEKNYDGKNFANISILQIENNKLISAIKSKRMVISHNKAILGDANIYKINNESIDFKYKKNKKINLLLDNKLIETLKKDPSDLSIIDIYGQVKFLSENNLDSRVFKIEMYKRMVKPFILITTTLFAMLFIFGSMRDSSMGRKLFLGIAISLILELYLRISGAMVLKFNYNYLIIVLLPITLFFITNLKLLVDKK